MARFPILCSALGLLAVTACSQERLPDEPDPTVEDTGPPTEQTPTVQPPSVFPVINELMASNRAAVADELGAFGDWIELYNPSDLAVSLAGFGLSDRVDRLHPLDPSLEIAAGGHLLLWADGAPELGPDHLPFRLSADGEFAVLSFGGAAVEVWGFGPQLADLSLARVADGDPDWEITETPTPGASNGGLPSAGLDAPELFCDPAVVAEPWLREGEVASLQVQCASGVAPSTFVPSAHGLPEGAVFAAGTVTWATDLADGGRHDVLFATKQRDRAGMPETAIGTVWVADLGTGPGDDPVDPLLYTEEWGLPVLHLQTTAPLTESYSAVWAAYRGELYSAQMKIRGAASTGYPKNNFTIEFDPEQIDLRPEGLNRKDHLVLISNFDDLSHARQKLVYDAWSDMALLWGDGRMAPRTFYTVLYLDGVYHGLYVGIDHVDDEFIREMGLLDGGGLYKSVNHDANFYLTDSSGRNKNTLHDGWEKKEGLPPGDFRGIELVTQFAGSASHTEFAADVDRYVARAEFMDWFLLVHHMAADDSAGKNAYTYEDPVLGVLRYVPWDFNHALGQDWRTLRVPSDATNWFTSTNALFWHFQSEAGLSIELWGRYGEMRRPGGPLSLDALHGHLDAMYAAIEPSARRDYARWGAEHRAHSLWSGLRSDYLTYEEERDALYQWVAERDGWASDFH